MTDDELAAAFPAFVPAPPKPPAPAPPPRVAGWQPAGKMTCPHGHPITRGETYLDGSVLIRCGWRHDADGRRAPETCGALFLAVVGTPLVDPHRPENRLVFTVEVSRQEASYLARERPPLLWILERVGATVRPMP